MLSKDVASSLRKQVSHKNYYTESPLVVLNGFSGEGAQMKLMTTTFQAMFPTINITKVNYASLRYPLAVFLFFDTSLE
jgi:ribosome biogenesis protein SSF1/2